MLGRFFVALLICLFGNSPLFSQTLTSIGVPPVNPYTRDPAQNSPWWETQLRETSADGKVLVGRHSNMPWKWEAGVFEYLTSHTGSGFADWQSVSISGNGETIALSRSILRNGAVVATFSNDDRIDDISSDGQTVAGRLKHPDEWGGVSPLRMVRREFHLSPWFAHRRFHQPAGGSFLCR